MIILWLFLVSVRTSGYKLFHHFLPIKTLSFWTRSLTEGEKKKEKKKAPLAAEKLQLLKTYFSQPNFLYIFARKSKPLCGAGPNPFSGT